MNDKWGRNFLGTPPQGRADYAFLQHIIASMNETQGRCAILFPHGVLFRDEELELRKKLVEMDILDCVIGLGANLFYNSPMEACILICNYSKANSKKNQVLMINAVNEVTRKNAESMLLAEHIQRIVNAYQKNSELDGFSRIVSNDEIREKKFNLNISLYAYQSVLHDALTVSKEDAINVWISSHSQCINEMNELIKLIE